MNLNLRFSVNFRGNSCEFFGVILWSNIEVISRLNSLSIKATIWRQFLIQHEFTVFQISENKIVHTVGHCDNSFQLLTFLINDKRADGS